MYTFSSLYYMRRGFAPNPTQNNPRTASEGTPLSSGGLSLEDGVALGMRAKGPFGVRVNPVRGRDEGSGSVRFKRSAPWESNSLRLAPPPLRRPRRIVAALGVGGGGMEGPSPPR